MHALVNEAEGRFQPKDEYQFPHILMSDTCTFGPESNPNLAKMLSAGDSTAAKELLDRELRAVDQLHKLLLEHKYHDVISRASKMISAKREFSSENSNHIFAFNIIPVAIYQMRGHAALKLKNYTLGTEDATAGLDLISVILRTTPPNDQKTWPCLRHQIMMEQSELLHLRGRCSNHLGDFDGALVDLRAAVALKYTLGEKVEPSTISEVLIVMARKKTASPRPHFSDSEIRAWNKELQIKEYSAENRLCFYCKRPPSEEQKLKLCGDCKKAWFCGNACMKAGWPSHKPFCRNKLKTVTIIPIGMEEIVRSDIAASGCYVTVDRNGPAVIVRDSMTGAIHESLSDQDVLFLPEDDPAAIEEAVMRYHGLI